MGGKFGIHQSKVMYVGNMIVVAFSAMRYNLIVTIGKILSSGNITLCWWWSYRALNSAESSKDKFHNNSFADFGNLI